MPEKVIDDLAYINSMKDICFGEDPELNHRYADAIICLLLRDLGYDELIDLYEQIVISK